MSETPENTTSTPTRRPFAAFLQEHRNGALHAELTEKLAELTDACVEQVKAGTLTLVVKIKPAAEGLHLYVEDNVSVKQPEPARASALYFHDGQGNLSRRDPNQLTFDGPLRKIDGDAPAAPTGEIAGEVQ